MAELQARSLDSAEETQTFDNGKAEIGYAMSGHLHVTADDGSEQEIRAGDSYNIPPGHDGWVVGDEAFLSVEFRSAADNART